MTTQLLPSGLFVVEPATPATYAVDPPAQCDICGRAAASGSWMFFNGRWNEDRTEWWCCAWPTCGHEKPLLCGVCRYYYWQTTGCRICGCKEEYT